MARNKAELVVEHVRRWELQNSAVDDRLGYRPAGTHGVVVVPPYADQQMFGEAGKLYVELTPGRDLPHSLRELRTAISNAQTEARKERSDR
jgi:hypothetical protein